MGFVTCSFLKEERYRCVPVQPWRLASDLERLVVRLKGGPNDAFVSSQAFINSYMSPEVLNRPPVDLPLALTFDENLYLLDLRKLSQGVGYGPQSQSFAGSAGSHLIGIKEYLLAEVDSAEAILNFQGQYRGRGGESGEEIVCGR
ncbi:hypothetical protein HKBW3C_03021, partial [Candidatus Hakubella thermalkaliphila]